MVLVKVLCVTLLAVLSVQIHLGAADPRPVILHATGQLQRRPRALSGFHIPHHDPSQQFHHTPVPVGLPHSASGFSALPAATAAPAVLSGTVMLCEKCLQRHIIDLSFTDCRWCCVMLFTVITQGFIFTDL